MSPLTFRGLGFLALAALAAACAHAPAAPPAPAPAADLLAPTAEGPDLGPDLGEGLSYSLVRSAEPGAFVAHVVEVDLRRPGLRFAVTAADPAGGMEHVAARTTEYLANTGADLAVNASYFLPFAGGSPGGDDYYPKSGQPASVSGAALSGGEQVSPVETDLDIRVNAIVCFDGADIAIEDGQVCPAGFTDGVAAGPRLLADGAARSFAEFDNRYATTPAPRTAIGVSAAGERAWLVVVDGRQEGYSRGASLDDLVVLFRDLGATQALNLDGGGSSTLVARGADGAPALLNRPIHTGVPGRERPVANHIGVFLAPAAK